MKRILTLMLAVAMLLTLTACSGTATPTASAKPAASAQTGASTATTAPTAAAASNKYDAAKKIIIGCVTSLSGERAQNGVYTKEALDMWAAEVNAAGGIIGKTVEIAYEDDQSTDQGGANAFQKLVSRGDINGAIVPVFSSIALALEPYVKQYQIPSFTAGSSVKFATLDDPYIWQIRYSDALAGNTMGKAAVDTLKMKKPAIIHESDSFGQGLADATKAQLAKLGVTDVKDLTYNKGEKNFAPFIAQIKDAGCDGIIAVSQQIEASLIMMQVKASNLNLPCLGSTSYCSEIAIKNAEASAEGWYSVSDWSPTIDTAKGKAFVDAYKKKYSKDPDLPSSTNYDSVQLIKAAIEMGKSCEPTAINNNIKKLKDVEGVASKYTPNEQRICATTQFLTKNVGGKALIQTIISR